MNNNYKKNPDRLYEYNIIYFSIIEKEKFLTRCNADLDGTNP